MMDPFQAAQNRYMVIDDPAMFGGGSSGGVDPQFQDDVTLALWQEGVDVTKLAPEQFQQLITALWQDPFLQDIFQSGTAGGDTTDSSTGVLISNFTPYIKRELFDPTQTHSQFLVQQGLSMLQRSGRQLTQQQSQYANNLFGSGDPAVMQAIARAAQETGVPYDLALAVATAESGLSNSAVGDQGCSFGLFQLNTCGGEGQGMSQDQLTDPYTNAVTALREFASVAAQDPSVRSDPGRWAALAQRPFDPSGYAGRVNNLLQSGFGGNPSGIIPRPFDGNFPITEDHDQGDPGIDYGTPVGTPMYTPFSGTIRTEDSGKANWGKRAMVVLDNGFTYAVGHLTSFSVANGQRVNPGELLGLSGGDPSDPSSGNTTGPHVELQWISPGGNFLDPHTVLDSIFGGNATFRSLNLAGAEGQGMSAASARDRLLGIDPILEAKYPGAVSAFQKYFGRHPTAKELHDLISHGTTPEELENWLRSQPSHIPGISIGVYQDVRGNLDAVSQKLFGHAGTDQMVKELVGEGKTSPTAVQFWLTQQDIAGKMGANWQQNYNAVYAAAAPHYQALTNDYGFDPRIAAHIYQTTQAKHPGQPLTAAPLPLMPPPDIQNQAEAAGGLWGFSNQSGVQKTIGDTAAGVF